MKNQQESHTDGSSFIARYEKLRREEILSGDPRGTSLANLSWTWELQAQEQEPSPDGPPEPSEPLSLQAAADESETTEQSVWSSYAQAHHVMIADPATLEVLLAVPATHVVDGQRDTNPRGADLQAGSEVPAEEPSLEEGWQDLPFPIAGEVSTPEAATKAGGQKLAPETHSEFPGQAEQQDSQDWSEVEAVLVAAAAAVEEGAAETTESALEEVGAEGELPQIPQFAGSHLAPTPEIRGSINGPMVPSTPWVLGRFVGLRGLTTTTENATSADFAELAGRLSGEGMGTWLSTLTNSFALNAVNGRSSDKSAATFQRESASSKPAGETKTSARR